MQTKRVYRRPKKTAVQLTSLLDLLFVMIFVSLLQQQKVNMPEKKEVKKGKLTEVKIPAKKTIPVITKKKEEPITSLVKATFDFYPVKSQQNSMSASGVYSMEGTYNRETRQLKLFGLSWIRKPRLEYDMVPLNGTVNESNDVITGKIQFLGCNVFKLAKNDIRQRENLKGVWTGQYNCGQGATGLTLTID